MAGCPVQDGVEPLTSTPTWDTGTYLGRPVPEVLSGGTRTLQAFPHKRLPKPLAPCWRQKKPLT